MHLHAPRMHPARRGFTLTEMFVVISLLAMLAAVLVPQFGSANDAASRNFLQTNVQILRSQVDLYQLQHNGLLPGGKGGGFDAVTFWEQLTQFTDIKGNLSRLQTPDFSYGPYLTAIPSNLLNGCQIVIDGALSPGETVALRCGYEFDFKQNSGRVFCTDSDGVTLLP